MTQRFRSLLFVAPVVATLAACSGSDGPIDETVGGENVMRILSCGLGCNGPDIGPISCGIIDVFVNQEFWFEFSQPVDIDSVSNSTLKIINSLTGQTPIGQFSVDSNNSRRVIFRPTLTFDLAGNPVFGLISGDSYEITIPGSNDDELGPYIENVAGARNTTRLNCFVKAALGVNDPVPGDPTATVFIDELDDDGEVINSFLASESEGVSQNSLVRIEFNDLMNPATLVNPLTSSAVFLTVGVDLDGLQSTLNDRVPIVGTYELDLDEDLNRTTVTFTPAGGLPSGGGDEDNPRTIFVDLPLSIVDLGGNELTNAGLVEFSTEIVAPVELTLTDDFTSVASADLERSGVELLPMQDFVQTLFDSDFTPVGTLDLTGAIIRGTGGGSGRLGSLVVESGDTLTLSTGPDVTTIFGPDLIEGTVDEDGFPTSDPEEIVAINVRSTILDNYAPFGPGKKKGDPPIGGPGSETFEVEAGVFEFDSLEIQPGATLTFVGDNPARLFVRGEANIRGKIDLRGTSPGQHPSDSGFGQDGAVGRAGGGDGGRGGDRIDAGGTDLLALGGFNHNNMDPISPNGSSGEGRGGVTPLGGNDFGAGGGGVQWPAVFPGPDLDQVGSTEANQLQGCFALEIGAPGAGGSYGFAGGSPSFNTSSATSFTSPPFPSAGSSVLPASSANLDPDAGGSLDGGAGGGGGGIGLKLTKLVGALLTGCEEEVESFLDHSAAAGGSGGGAMQIQAGRRLFLDSSIDLAGGDGGSVDLDATTEGSYATPGGGGSGGALLLQSIDLAIAPLPNSILVSGGDGGVLFDNNDQFRAGRGGPGIVQLQNSPDVPLVLEDEFDKIQVFTGSTPGNFDPEDSLSVGNWLPNNTGTGRQSGYQSCWIQPEGSFFSVNFLEDDLSALDPDDHIYGWNMKVALDSVFGVVDYRGNSGLVSQFLGVDLETLLGNDVGNSLISIRFQGARAVAPIENPCDEDSALASIVSNSITPWVRSPAELNTYWQEVFPDTPSIAIQRQPNIIRYALVIDGGAANAALLSGIVEVSVMVDAN